MRLPGDERDVLAALPAQLREALDAEEPTLYRLFPPAFADDDAANAEYARLVGDEPARRQAARARPARADSARGARSPRTSSGAWLGALESLRLALGTQLDVTEESYGALDTSDPDAPRLALYHWLSWLQEEVVQALATSLPDPPDE